MPTVILLDNSLSMSRYAKPTNDTMKGIKEESLTNQSLSHLIIRRLINHFNKIEKPEYLAVVSYSATVTVISEFTTNYNKILTSLEALRPGTSACLEQGLNKVSDLVIDEWACFTNIQVLLITDSLDSLHDDSVKSVCSRLKENKVLLRDFYLSNGIDFDNRVHVNSILNEDILKSNFFVNSANNRNYFNIKYPFSFPNKFDIICLADYELKDDFIKVEDNKSKYETLAYFDQKIIQWGFDDENFRVKRSYEKTNSKLFYLNELIELNNSTGALYITKMHKIKPNFEETQFCEEIFTDLFKEYICKLKCGHLEANITLVPAPLPYKGYQCYSYVEKEISRNFEICGFINISELTTPPTISRHLIIANRDEGEIKSEDLAVPSFAVLLHSSLKSEGMAAIVYLDNEWYGAVHCWQDAKSVEAKNKSNLMLSLFVPGNDVIQNIISKLNQTTKPQGANPNQPVKPLPIKSYTKGCIVWYRSDNLVSDLQKIIRNAKKMQDKLPIFYKELNRVRKAALSFGFYELFEGLSKMLQRELNSPNNVNNQELVVQLNHCIYCLRSPEFRDFRKDILPFTRYDRK